MTASTPPISFDDLLAHESFVRAVARGLLSSEDAVQDVVQDTFTRALERPPHERGSLKGWLATVARNLARDHYRGEGRRRAREAAVARPEESLDTSAARIEVFGAVARAVLALDEPYMSVVVLAYYQDLSPARIAERLGRNPATVRSQLFRAHEVLRARLDGEVDGGREAWAGLLLPLVVPGSAEPAASLAGSSPLLGSSAVKLAVLGLVGVALLIGLPLALWSGGPGPEGENPGDEVSTLLAKADRAADVPVDGGQVAESEEAATRSERVPVMGAGAALDVTVRDAAGPVAGVAVWLAEKPRFVGAMERSPLLAERNPVYLVELLGEQRKTDEAGHVSLPWSGSECLVWAAGEASQAFMTVAPDAEPELELLLGGSAPLTVRVVDENGEGLEGVPLGEYFGEQGRSLESTFKGRETGADGTSEFRDLSALVPPEMPRDFVQAATLAVPGLPTEPIWLPTGAEAPRTVEVELGPTGGLDLEVVDEDGKALATLGMVTLKAVGAEDFGEQLALVVAGHAHFEYVGLGAEFDVRLRVANRGVDEHLTIRGPVRRGETATAELVVPTRPLLRGTVVDASGSVVRETKLTLELFSPELKGPAHIELRTDALGHFETRVPESIPLGTTVGGELLLRKRGGPGIYGARADLEPAFVVHAGFEELGEFGLRPIAGALRGVCVDADGAPIEGLQVMAVRESEATLWGAYTDSKGAFVLNGTWYEAPALELPMSESWVLAEGQHFDLNDPANRVVCLEGGHLRGRILTGSDVESGGLSVSAWDERLEDPSRSHWSALGSTRAGDGSFDLGGLERGVYTLRVRSANALVREVHGLRVAPGEVVDVGSIELAQSFVTLDFDVRDAKGKLLYSPLASIYIGGEAAASTNADHGHVKLVGPTAPDAVLLVQDPGSIPKVLPVESNLETVVLERGIEVHLYAHGRPALRDGKRSALLQLSRPAGDPRLGDERFSGSISASLAEEGSASVLLPGRGTYQLEVSIHEPMSGGLMLAGMAEPLPGDFTLEIHADDAGKTFEVPLPENLFE
jgi:RNA polymerase sigma-70 factor (ECF subfamily)